jgi:hypothetical protein
MDLNIKVVEKVYNLSEKLGIRILTIEEVLEEEAKALKKESRLGKIQLYEEHSRSNADVQYHDFIKLYFNDISKIPLLT